MLRGSNFISSDSYIRMIFLRKYLLAGRLKVRRIFALPLNHNHVAGFKNGEYGGKNIGLIKLLFFFKYRFTWLEL